MRTLFFYIKIIVLILTFLFNVNFCIYGSTIYDLQNKQKKIIKDRLFIKKSLDEAESKMSDAEKDLKNIDIKLEKNYLELEAISNNLMKIQNELNLAKIELEKAEALRKKQYDIFVKRARYMYKNSNLTYIDVILKSENFNDLLKRIDYINKIIRYDNSLLNNLIFTEKSVLENVKFIENKKKELEILKLQEISRKDNYESAKIEKENLINKFSKESEKYRDELSALEESSKRIESLIKEKQKKLESNGSTSLKFKPKGKLSWPVPGRMHISSGFGVRIHPITGKRKGHTGIDIPGPSNTNIVAVEDGIVIGASYLNGYGNTVIINHGDGISTLYAHNLKNIVKVGQLVKQGDIIAKIGSTGLATGNHLHFEVRLNGIPTSPMKYLK